MMRSMNRSFPKLVTSLCLLFAGNLTAQTNTPDTSVWRNPEKALGERVQALMAQLTLKEKISLIYWLAPAIDRLGIKEYHHGNECLHGLVRPGKFTVFPQAIGLGATFDPEGVHRISSAISDEARAKWNETGGKHLGTYSDVLTVWSPVVNMARDPRWGRTQETYGEDPWLTSRLGVAFVKGLQGDDPRYLKIISTPKHFAGNNEEGGRFGKNIICDERYLREYELFPFHACIEEGRAESIMSAYTAINGVPCSANKWLLTDVLRKEWGFKGYVVSDCGAVSHVVDAHHYASSPEEAIADCLNAGLDMEGGYFAKYPDVMNNYLPQAIEKGLVTQEVVDHAVSLVLEGRFKLGMYDPPEMVPYSKIPSSVIGSEEHVALARKLADESIVLLRNEQQGGKPLLPIDPTKSAKIFVVGPNANVMQLGDYEGNPTETVTPFEGIKERATKAGLTATLLPWSGSQLDVVPSDCLKPTASEDEKATGLSAEYFTSVDFTGEPKAKRIDQKLNFDWAHIEPDPLASDSKFSVRWTGDLITKIPGTYTFSIKADGGYRLFIDDKKLIDNWSHNDARRGTTSAEIDSLTAGKHSIRIEYRHLGGETGFVLSWSPPAGDDFYGILKNADLVIAVMGISTDYEIEGKDRTTLALPRYQEEFLSKVMSVNPRTLAVFESGSPLAVSWSATNIPAILQAWYPGQEGGRAIADVLFGDYNPAGRLPLTFYASDDQLRPMSEYDLTKGRTYMYLQQKPLYPFGHGLSYTSFQYSALKLSKTTASTQDQVTVSVDVTNTGARDGADVVQCYVHAPQSRVPMPLKQLWAFKRVYIPKGETKTVTLDLDTKNFGHWDKERQSFVVEPGKFEIMIGGSSEDIREKAILDLVSKN
jgi:beta-glucosidase